MDYKSIIKTYQPWFRIHKLAYAYSYSLKCVSYSFFENFFNLIFFKIFGMRKNNNLTNQSNR